MRVFMDDERDHPSVERCGFSAEKWDVVCRESWRAIQLLQTGTVTFILLDHWMSSGDQNGLDVATWIRDAAVAGTLPKLDWDIHTGDIDKKRAMFRVLREADKAWETR